jgi:6-pyruvoyltetrahydropterin/6-carboxytetrahydropterin synthase
MLYLTRRETFNAAHRLFRPDWSDEENLKVFGKCSNPEWHGHNYELYVTVKGEINPETGLVVNLKVLSNVINEKITTKIDHMNITTQVEFMKGRQSSTENLAIAIWETLDPHVRLLDVELHCIKIVETQNNFVEYYGK